MYNIVLVHPEIAGNTGQIGRSCMALNCCLHLVHPLGYEITDKNLKRAGMDYWPQLNLVEHTSLEVWMNSIKKDEIWLMSTKGQCDFAPSKISEGATLVFGNEGSGLPQAVWQRWGDQALKIPMNSKARSINLSASVAMVLGALSFGGN